VLTKRQLDFDLIAELYGPGATARTIQSKMKKSRCIGEIILAARKDKMQTGEIPAGNKRAWVLANAESDARVADSLISLSNVKSYLGREKSLMESLPAYLPVFHNKKRKTDRGGRVSEFSTNTGHPDLQDFDVVDLSSDTEIAREDKHVTKPGRTLNVRGRWPSWTESDWPAQSRKLDQNAQPNKDVLSDWNKRIEQEFRSKNLHWGASSNQEAQHDWSAQHSWNAGSSKDNQSCSDALPEWGTEEYQNARNKCHARHLSRQSNTRAIPQNQQWTDQNRGWTDTAINHGGVPTSFMGRISPVVWDRPGRQFARSVSQQNEENERSYWGN
jgi:hypothetical protein